MNTFPFLLLCLWCLMFWLLIVLADNSDASK
jgi:hypothetical protein